MELFRKARTVRLRSYHDKYLLAHPDGESVWLDRDGSSPNAIWSVEFIPNRNALRLKSCLFNYLTASDGIYLLGVAGRKVTQTAPSQVVDYCLIEWEPVRDGVEVRLRTRTGHFLRANSGLPPVRNSVTHDIPRRSVTQEWILWDVEVVDSVNKKRQRQHQQPDDESRTLESIMSSPTYSSELKDKMAKKGAVRSKKGRYLATPLFYREEECSQLPPDERLIYYNVMDDKGEIVEMAERPFFGFKGNEVGALKQILAQQTGLRDFIVCSRNPFDGKLYSLKLYLPPSNEIMHVFVVPSVSKAAIDILIAP